MRKRKSDRPIAVFDCETDPFEHGKTIAPFAIGFYDGTRYLRWWGDDCVDNFVAFLDTEPAHVIYAHNGGKFDFLFLLKHLADPFVMNARIVKAQLGKHELRDSFSIIPVPLAQYQKDSIDYRLMTRDKREANKAEILAYLKTDCTALYELVQRFIASFGRKLTIASTALGKLREVHPFERLTDHHDAKFRPYYFGGRCQHFEAGELSDDWTVLDVNSMYPFVMATFDHPIGPRYEWSRSIDKARASGKPFFITFEGDNFNALPVRTKAGLSFEVRSGVFNACSHEFTAGVDAGRIRVRRVFDIWIPAQTVRFATFVNDCIVGKLRAEQAGDKAGRLFYKLLANSSYGKFAQNPDKYCDWMIRQTGEPYPGEDWNVYAEFDGGEFWRRPARKVGGFIDVAVAASITSAARSILLDALLRAERPIYCDTDSIIARSVDVQHDDSRLGAWKLEATANRAFVAGKKLYALYTDQTPVKWASKGVRLTPEEIARVANGETIIWRSEAPSMKLDGSQQFITRRIEKRA